MCRQVYKSQVWPLISKLNINKTKIYGIGNWKGRDQWSIINLITETNFFSALGIYYSNNYQESVDKNWNETISKIRKHTNMLLNRKLTLHQRVIYANTCILSKLRYISHIYPLSENLFKTKYLKSPILIFSFLVRQIVII